MGGGRVGVLGEDALSGYTVGCSSCSHPSTPTINVVSGSLIPRYVGIAGAYSPEDTTYQTNQHTHTIPKSALLSCSEESSFLAFLFACFNGILRKNVYHHVYNGDTSFSFYLMIGTLMLCQSNTNRAPQQSTHEKRSLETENMYTTHSYILHK